MARNSAFFSCKQYIVNHFNGTLLSLFILLVQYGAANAGVPDTLLLMNGKEIVVNRTRVDGDLVAYEKIKKSGKIKKPNYVGLELVYSIRYANGTDTVLYSENNPLYQDAGYSAEEMYYFIKGQQDAREYHKTGLIFTGGVIFGGVGGYFLYDQIVVATVPFAYTVGIGISVPKMNEVEGENMLLQRNEAYQMGFIKAARSKRVFAALAGSLIGSVAAVTGGFLANP